jgi:hypothetical protein
MTATAPLSDQIIAAIRRGQNRANWSVSWTDVNYGVAEQVAPLVRDSVCTLERANEQLVAEGFYPLGPDLHSFVWGPITEIHRIGEHAIVEYTTREAFLAAEAKMGGGGQQAFSIYTTVNGEMRSTSHSEGSLDEAVLHAIVYATEAHAYGVNVAANSQALRYVRRMIGMEREGR